MCAPGCRHVGLRSGVHQEIKGAWVGDEWQEGHASCYLPNDRSNLAIDLLL